MTRDGDARGAGDRRWPMSSLTTNASTCARPTPSTRSRIEDHVDAVVVAMDGQGPLELLGAVHAKAPDAAVVVVTEAEHEADGAVAMHAGAEDHLVVGSIPPGLLPRSVRYAVSIRRLRRELAATDEVDRPAEPARLRADRRAPPAHGRSQQGPRGVPVRAARGRDRARTGSPGRRGAARGGPRRGPTGAHHRGHVHRAAHRRGGRGRDTVLSRLVEAIAVHNAKQDPPQPLSLSVGSAIYDPEHPRRCRRSSRRPDGACTIKRRADPSDRRASCEYPARRTRSVDGAVVAGNDDVGPERVDGHR